MEPDSDGVYKGNGWRYVSQDSSLPDKDTLYLGGNSFDLSGAFIRCNVVVSDKTTVKNASFGRYSPIYQTTVTITNNGTLQSCVFYQCHLINNGTAIVQKSSIHNGTVANKGTIDDTSFILDISSTTPPLTFTESGTITNSLFNFDPTQHGLTSSNIHTLTALDTDGNQCSLQVVSASDPTGTLSSYSSTYYTIGKPTIRVRCSNTAAPEADDYKVCSVNALPVELYDSNFHHDGVCYVFTVQDENITLRSILPALEIGRYGVLKIDGMTPYNGVYYGDGWTYEVIDSNYRTLTLKRGTYDFTNTKPITKDGDPLEYLNVDVIVNEGVTITGGIFWAPVVSNSGTIQNSSFLESFENHGGTVTNSIFILQPTGVKCCVLSAVDGSIIIFVPNYSSPVIDYIICNRSTYYFTGTPKFTVKLENSDIHCINGRIDYGGLKPSEPLEPSDVHGYYTFTPPIAEDIVLNRKPYATDLVMTTDGIPDTTNVAGGKDGTHFSYKGDGWTFTGAADISDAIGTLTLKNTNSYDFSCLDPLKGTGGELAAVKCPLINDGATIKDGVFKNLVINHSGTISGGTFAVDLASINSEDFSTSGTVTGGAFNGKDGLSDGAHAVTVKGGSILKVNDTEPLEANEINDAYGTRYDIVSSAKWNLYSYEGTIVTVTADTDITNINGWNIGWFPGSSYPNGEDDKTTVRFRMPNGPVVLNDTLYTLEIIRGNTLGNTSVSAPAGTELILDADEPAKNETFLGWTLNDESLLTKGKLNDPECTTITIKMKAASATAEAKFQKDTPAYTLTVTGGGLVNGKTSAVVEAGKEVCLTVGEMQDGMSFNYWDLPTALTKALMDKELTDKDFSFSNKVETLTFTMPDLSEYTEDTRFTIRLDIRPAELPDDDDGPSVLGTMATVAVGGAAAGILVWQGVSLGVDSYLQLSLPGGVPVPTNRIELVKLLWETAGKPDVVLPALYGDVSAEDGELQKATRWAIDNGLVKGAGFSLPERSASHHVESPSQPHL